MSEQTKSCALTEDEIEQLIAYNCSRVMCIAGSAIVDNKDKYIERINYLNKRLKTFKESEVKPAYVPSDTNPVPSNAWGNANNG